MCFLSILKVPIPKKVSLQNNLNINPQNKTSNFVAKDFLEARQPEINIAHSKIQKALGNFQKALGKFDVPRSF